MHRFFNLLFFLFLIPTTWSQQKDSVVEYRIQTSYGDFVFKSHYSATHSWSSFGIAHFTKLDEAIEKEAESRKIFEDKVIVKLEISEKGELVNYSLHKPGKLESVNVFISKVMDELIKKSREKSIVLGSNFSVDGTALMPFKFSLK